MRDERAGAQDLNQDGKPDPSARRSALQKHSLMSVTAIRRVRDHRFLTQDSGASFRVRMPPEQADASTEAPTRTRGGWRRAVALALPTLYVGGVAVYRGEASPLQWICLSLGLSVSLLGSLSRAFDTPAEARARRWTASALALALASAALTPRSAWVAFTREIALTGATLAAVRALATIDRDPGLAALATDAFAARSIRLATLERSARAVVIAAWGSAALVEGLVWSGIAPRMADTAAVASAIGGSASLFAIGAFALLIERARRFELGASPRALACSTAAGFALVVSLALTLASSVQPDAAAALGSAIAAPVAVALARTRDALGLARRRRRLLTLTLFGGPVAALALIAGESHSANSGILTMAIALATLGLGAAVSKLERNFLPAKGLLLDALAVATQSARESEGRTAMAKALVHLRDATGHGASSPELWTLHPTRVCTVDAAGYLDEKPAELPSQLIDIARGEPGGALRVEILRALEVRRADLRPLLRWLEDRGALFAVLVAESDEADGVIIVPAGTRTEPLSIEELHAAKLFADSFIAVCQSRSARSRHLEREKVLSDRASKTERENTALRRASALDDARHRLATLHLARRATVGVYSSTTRLAEGALDRQFQNDAPVVVVARTGIDAIAPMARAHLTGPRDNRPFVVVDATSSREHDLEYWRDPATSPMALAEGGRLVLVDGCALPREIQRLIATALQQRRSPWQPSAPIDIALAFTATVTPAKLLQDNLLDAELFAHFDQVTPVALAGLRERGEDLFAIVADRLAREGLRVRGTPIGIEAAAFARFVEYPFEGEDHELAALVTRLVLHGNGDVVRVADMDAIGLRAGPEVTKAY